MPSEVELGIQPVSYTHLDVYKRQGELISEELGIKLESVTLAMLGTAKKVLIEKENTTIVEGAGKKADITARCNQIRAQIEDTTSVSYTHLPPNRRWPSQ